MLLDGFSSDSAVFVNGRWIHRGSLQVQKCGNLRRSSKRRASEPAQPPRTPSPPSLAHLTPEELDILNNVIQKQEQFEQEEANRITYMRKELEVLEQRVKQASSTKSKLKQADLRLCRLCFKTKFADGIGRSCYECHKRVCNRCGNFSKAQWNERKKKFSRSKWRCNICNKRREVLMATGMWYHGEEAHPAFNKAVLTQNISSTPDPEPHGSGFSYEHTQRILENRAEHNRSLLVAGKPFIESDKLGPKCSDKQSEKVLEGHDDEMFVDEDTFHQERRKSRRERALQLKMQGKRRLRRLSVGTSTEEDGIVTDEVPSMVDFETCPQHGFTSKHTSHTIMTSKTSFQGNDKPDILEKSDNKIMTKHKSASNVMFVNNAAHGCNSSMLVRRIDPQVRNTETERNSETAHRRITRALRSESFTKCDRMPDHDIRKKTQRSHSLISPLSNRHYHRYNEQHKKLPSPQGSQGSNSSISLRKHVSELNKSTSQSERNSRQSSLDYNHIVSSSENNINKDIDSIGIPKISIIRPSIKGGNRLKQCFHRDINEGHVTGVQRSQEKMIQEKEKRKMALLLREDSDIMSINSSPATPEKEQRKFRYDDFRKSKHSINSCGSIKSSNSLALPSTASSLTSFQTMSSDRGTSFGSLLYYTHDTPQFYNDGIDDNRVNSLSEYRTVRYKPKSSVEEFEDDVCYDGLPSFIANPITDEDKRKKEHTLLAQTKASFRRNSVGNQVITCLCRNPNEENCRTNGLGMVVIGGKVGEDGKLGAYVVEVLPVGSAHMCGICVGDQILEWNGCSLEDATFEEVKQIMKNSGDKVQIIFTYNRNGEKHPPSREPSFSTENDTPALLSAQNSVESNKSGQSLFQYGKKRNTFVGIPPAQIWNPRPMRRTLPRTPDEIKQLRGDRGEEEIQLKLHFESHNNNLSVFVAQVKGIKENEKGSDKASVKCSAFVRIRLLEHGQKSKIKEKFTNLVPKEQTVTWNKLFLYEQVTAEMLEGMALEATFWIENGSQVSFHGEVLLDLEHANLDDQCVWYSLENHDENNGELYYPCKVSSKSLKKSGSSTESDVTWKSLPLQNILRISKSQSIKKNYSGLSVSSWNQDASEVRGSAPDLYRSKNNTASELDLPRVAQRSASDRASKRDGKLADRVHDFRLRVKSAVHHVSIKLNDKRATSNDEELKKESKRRLSESNLTIHDTKKDTGPKLMYMQSLDIPAIRPDNIELNIPSNRSSKLSLCGAISPYSRPTSSAASDIDDGRDSCYFKSEDGDERPMLGPGQLSSKLDQEETQGDLKLGLVITKGQLEIDVICARGLVAESSNDTPPDTYVKACLVGQNRKYMRKKTKTIKCDSNPLYKQKIRYSANNVHGRYLQVSIKQKLGNFERNISLGEVVIKLDNLHLSGNLTAWYRLFKEGTTSFGSTESVTLA